ncbi:MAG TPA: putative hydro-lyase [Steroidobacteraceae bacterium]
MYQNATAAQMVRQRIRQGQETGQTSGMARGFVQGNVVILPADWAGDFLRFCQANPKPCPLLAVSDPGDPTLPTLGTDIDIRTDVPRYVLFRDGDRTPGDITDIRDYWRNDFVTFILGCSFSFEEDLLADGVPVRHIELGRNVPMYRTSIECTSAGRFQSNMVVSMRPLIPKDAIRAIQLTSRFPSVHGAPIHFGDPLAIGIRDLEHPDFGDPVPVNAQEVPVFWACGCTPQLAIRAARPPIAIMHSPGHMLITDMRNTQLSVI